MEEEHYDTPWEYKTKFANALRPRPHSSNVMMMPSCSGEQTQFENNHKSMIIRPSENGSPSSPPQPKFLKKTSNFKDTPPSKNGTPDLEHSRRRRTEIPSGGGNDYPYVKNVTNSRISSGVAASLAKKLPFSEEDLIHENLDRIEAEQLLYSRQIGDFLLRKRQEGNLALSLKASEGVLHIKLEKRDNNHWVLGEGPQFPSISGCLKFYYRKALPIKGSEHILLRAPLQNRNYGKV